MNPKYWLNQPIVLLRFSKYCIQYFYFLIIILLISSLYFFFYNVVIDIQQSENFKIFYIHVPSAWLAVSIYIVMVLSSFLYIISSMKINQLIINSSTNIGTIFTFITLFTGSLWGLTTWGTLWVWDARLTSSLILFIFYLIFYFFKRIFSNNHNSFFILSLICVFSSVNIPILKYSVNWWNTLHQVQTIDSFNSLMDKSMFLLIILFMLTLSIYVCLYYFIEIRCYIIKNKINVLNTLYKN